MIIILTFEVVLVDFNGTVFDKILREYGRK